MFIHTVYAAVLNEIRNDRLFFLIRLPLANSANGSFSFVRLLSKKQTKVIRWQTD